MAALAGLSPANEVRLEETMEALWAGADVVIVDAAPNDLPNCAVADDLMLVTQADAHSMTETYRLVKRLTKGCGRLRASVLINRVRIPAQADRFFGNLSMTATQFLGIALELGGRIPYDEYMERATLSRQPVVEEFPSAPSSKMLLNCAETLLNRPESGARQGGAFAGRLIAVARDLREPHSTASPARSMRAAIQFDKIAPG
jgi:flagellar biosynthesis protein FlhG